MHNVITIVKRELYEYFTTPLAYVFAAIFVALTGVFTFYVGGFFERGQADLLPFFMFLPWLYLLLIPAISMRLWADERKTGSIEFLLTLPFSTTEIVAGKFLAAWIFCSLCLVFTMPLWLTVNILGQPDNGVIFASYKGATLMAGAYLAVGACVSALTRNQVIAFVLAAVLCFVFVMSGMHVVQNVITPVVPEFIAEAVAGLSFLTHFQSIQKGVIDLRDIVFFAGFIGFFGFVNVLVVEMRKSAGFSKSFAGAVVLGFLLLLSVNTISQNAFSNARIDLTEDRLYTLSDGTAQVLDALAEPVTLKLYFTSEMGKISPRHLQYYSRVRELLTRFEDVSNGKVKAVFYDPEPFSEIEDDAVASGLNGIALSEAGEVGYFGLVATNALDDQRVIAFFDPQREAFLEYDLVKLVYSLSDPALKTVGVISSLPLDGGTGSSMVRVGQKWDILQQIEEFYDVQILDNDVGQIGDDIDLLMVVQPVGMPKSTLYAIDQFVMAGGKTMVFVDPNCEKAGSRSMQQGFAMPTVTDPAFVDMMASWGIEMQIARVAGDMEAATQVQTVENGRPTLASYLGWLKLSADHLSADDVVTGDLTGLIMATAGILKPVDGVGTTVHPLVETSTESMAIPVTDIQVKPDVAKLLRNFKPSGEKKILAARLTGPAKSGFGESRPEGLETTQKDDGSPFEVAKVAGGDDTTQQDEEPAVVAQHLAKAKEGIHVVVVADADMLASEFWVQKQSLFGHVLQMPISDNATFVLNTLENLSGGSALAGLRARGRSDKPFKMVETIRQQAEIRYRAEEEHLMARLNKLQNELSAMAQKGESGSDVILTGEDREKIEQFRLRMVETRKALREVQHALRSDIEFLGSLLKFLNIAVVPLLLMLALALMLLQRARRANTGTPAK